MAADEPAAGAPARSAAFFDLDKTLMEGSSAFQFARAAYRAGLMGRRQLVADAIANLRFRLNGATDEDSLALRERIAAGLAGRRVVELERLGADVLAGILPRIYPRMLAVAHEHQDAGRRAYIVTAAARELAETLARV
ncbi:MAG: HAD family hydrolase, partial [Solirubrobacteraceae bacterium]